MARGRPRRKRESAASHSTGSRVVYSSLEEERAARQGSLRRSRGVDTDDGDLLSATELEDRLSFVEGFLRSGQPTRDRVAAHSDHLPMSLTGVLNSTRSESRVSGGGGGGGSVSGARDYTPRPPPSRRPASAMVSARPVDLTDSYAESSRPRTAASANRTRGETPSNKRLNPRTRPTTAPSHASRSRQRAAGPVTKKYPYVPKPRLRRQGVAVPPDAVWNHKQARTRVKHLYEQPVCTCGAGDVDFLFVYNTSGGDSVAQSRVAVCDVHGVDGASRRPHEPDGPVKLAKPPKSETAGMALSVNAVSRQKRVRVSDVITDLMDGKQLDSGRAVAGQKGGSDDEGIVMDTTVYNIVKRLSAKQPVIEDSIFSTTLGGHESHVAVFPSLRPTGREDVNELSKRLDALIRDLASRHVVRVADNGVIEPSEVDHSDPTEMHALLALCQEEQMLYNMCFHELIRQVTVECADRGAVLAKIRLVYAALFSKVPKAVRSMFASLVSERERASVLHREVTELRDTLQQAMTNVERLKDSNSRLTVKAMVATSKQTKEEREHAKAEELLSDYMHLCDLQRKRASQNLERVKKEKDVWLTASEKLLGQVAAAHVPAREFADLRATLTLWRDKVEYIIDTLGREYRVGLATMENQHSEWVETVHRLTKSVQADDTATAKAMSALSARMSGWCSKLRGELQTRGDLYHDEVVSFAHALHDFIGDAIKGAGRYSGDSAVGVEDDSIYLVKNFTAWLDTSAFLISRGGAEWEAEVEEMSASNRGIVTEWMKAFDEHIRGEDGLGGLVFRTIGALEDMHETVTAAVNSAVAIPKEQVQSLLKLFQKLTVDMEHFAHATSQAVKLSTSGAREAVTALTAWQARIGHRVSSDADVLTNKLTEAYESAEMWMVLLMTVSCPEDLVDVGKVLPETRHALQEINSQVVKRFERAGTSAAELASMTTVLGNWLDLAVKLGAKLSDEIFYEDISTPQIVGGSGSSSTAAFDLAFARLKPGNEPGMATKSIPRLNQLRGHTFGNSSPMLGDTKLHDPFTNSNDNVGGILEKSQSLEAASEAEERFTKRVLREDIRRRSDSMASVSGIRAELSQLFAASDDLAEIVEETLMQSPTSPSFPKPARKRGSEERSSSSGGDGESNSDGGDGEVSEASRSVRSLHLDRQKTEMLFPEPSIPDVRVEGATPRSDSDEDKEGEQRQTVESEKTRRPPPLRRPQFSALGSNASEAEIALDHGLYGTPERGSESEFADADLAEESAVVAMEFEVDTGSNHSDDESEGERGSESGESVRTTEDGGEGVGVGGGRGDEGGESLDSATTTTTATATTTTTVTSAAAATATDSHTTTARTHHRTVGVQVFISTGGDSRRSQSSHNYAKLEDRVEAVEARFAALGEALSGSHSQLDLTGRLSSLESRIAEHENTRQAKAVQHGRNKGTLNTTSRAKKLITSKVAKRDPKPRAWCVRTVRELYAVKMAIDAIDDRENHAREPFPEFVIDHLSNKYGLKAVLDQVYADLLVTAAHHRDSVDEVNQFAEFLEEARPLDQLSFFLYCRSLVIESGRGKLVPSDESAVLPQYICLVRANDVATKALTFLGMETVSTFTHAVQTASVAATTLPAAYGDDTNSGAGGKRKSRATSSNPRHRRILVTTFLELILTEYVEAGHRHTERLTDLFHLADLNNDGHLSLVEFRKIVLKVDPTKSRRQITRLFRETVVRYGSLTLDAFTEIAPQLGFSQAALGHSISKMTLANSNAAASSFGVGASGDDSNKSVQALSNHARRVLNVLRHTWKDFQPVLAKLLSTLAASQRYRDQSCAHAVFDLKEQLDKALLISSDSKEVLYVYRNLLNTILTHMQASGVGVRGKTQHTEPLSIELTGIQRLIADRIAYDERVAEGESEESSSSSSDDELDDGSSDGSTSTSRTADKPTDPVLIHANAAGMWAQAALKALAAHKEKQSNSLAPPSIPVAAQGRSVSQPNLFAG